MDRKCEICAEIKALITDNFRKDKNRKHGFEYICKPCKRAREIRAYRNGGKEAKRQYFQTENGSAVRRKSLLKWHHNPENRMKRRAQWALKQAVKRGVIVRPSHCEICDIECKPHAHHPSYKKSKRLEVMWVCPQCHKNLHGATIGGD